MSARDDYSKTFFEDDDWYDTAMDEIDRLRSALKWIRQVATVHYIGGAFDPEHMGELANMATDALNGEPVIDYDAAMERAKVKAAEWFTMFNETSTANQGDST